MAVIAAAYSFSYGPLCWLVTAELFSAGVRVHPPTAVDIDGFVIVTEFSLRFHSSYLGCLVTMIQCTPAHVRLLPPLTHTTKPQPANHAVGKAFGAGWGWHPVVILEREREGEGESS
eukprot:SAG25_NODE_845_length_5085_cov_16.777978_6_plen_117_part_00